MATSNPITGDLIKSKTGNSTAYAEGYERIFGKKEEPEAKPETEKLQEEQVFQINS